MRDAGNGLDDICVKGCPTAPMRFPHDVTTPLKHVGAKLVSALLTAWPVVEASALASWSQTPANVRTTRTGSSVKVAERDAKAGLCA